MKGTAPSQVNPLAIAAMVERGIAIGHHRSKHVNELLEQRFDVIKGFKIRIFPLLTSPSSSTGRIQLAGGKLLFAYGIRFQQ